MIDLLKKIFVKSDKNISTWALEETLANKKITLLDVRTSQEYHRGHIKEARPFPLETINKYRGSKEQPIYVICQSGMRSKRAAKILNQNGYEVINVRGGMSAWGGKMIGGKS